MAVFPPTEASTWDSKVEGNRTKSTPLRKVAAANPVMSQIIPPPRAKRMHSLL